MTERATLATKEDRSKFTPRVADWMEKEENFTFLVVLLGIVTLTTGMAVLLGPGGLLTAVGVWLLAVGLRSRVW